MFTFVQNLGSYDSWIIKETDHIIFYFQPDTNVKDIEKYIADREQSFIKIQGFFNSVLPKKIDFFVWNSNEDAQKVINRVLGFARPEYSIVHSRSNQTLGHEMTHVISHYSGVKTKSGLINEGVAVYFNQSNDDKLQIARKAIQDTKGVKVDVKALWLKWQGGDVENITYPLAGAFVKFLIEEEGKDKFFELLKNQTYDSAKVIYGDKIDELIMRFEKLLQ